MREQRDEEEEEEVERERHLAGRDAEGERQRDEEEEVEVERERHLAGREAEGPVRRHVQAPHGGPVSGQQQNLLEPEARRGEEGVRRQEDG